jgi:hypothetical protein
MQIEKCKFECRFHFAIFNSQFSILNSQFSILNFQFSIFNSQFSILNSQFSILNSLFRFPSFLPSAFRRLPSVFRLPFRDLRVPTMTHYQLNCLLGIAAIKLYLHFAARIDRVDSAGQLVRSANRLIIKFGDDVAQVESEEISGTIVDYAMDLQTPSFCSVDTATASHIANAQKALSSRIDLWLKRDHGRAADANSGGDRLLVAIEFDSNFRAGFHCV